MSTILYRGLAAVFVAASLAALAGTVHGRLSALLVAGAACAFTLAGVAVFWKRPAAACAVAGLAVLLEFNVGSTLPDGLAGAGALAFAGLGRR